MSLDVDLDADKEAQKASHVSLFGDSALQLEIVLGSYRMGIALVCCLLLVCGLRVSGHLENYCFCGHKLCVT